MSVAASPVRTNGALQKAISVAEAVRAHHLPAERIRTVALSATLPNLADVAVLSTRSLSALPQPCALAMLACATFCGRTVADRVSAALSTLHAAGLAPLVMR